MSSDLDRAVDRLLGGVDESVDEKKKGKMPAGFLKYLKGKKGKDKGGKDKDGGKLDKLSRGKNPMDDDGDEDETPKKKGGKGLPPWLRKKGKKESIGEAEEHKITSTFDVIDPDQTAGGDYAESGWENQEGDSVEPDNLDVEDGLTAVDKAVEYLQDKGATEPSSTFFHPNLWYSTADGEVDYGTGEETHHSYFLNGFTPDEELQVFRQMSPRGYVGKESKKESLGESAGEVPISAQKAKSLSSNYRMCLRGYLVPVSWHGERWQMGHVDVPPGWYVQPITGPRYGESLDRSAVIDSVLRDVLTERTLTVPEKHQLRIAYSTLKMSDVGARIMGGMTKDEARDVIRRLTGQNYAINPATVDSKEQKPTPKIQEDGKTIIPGIRGDLRDQIIDAVKAAAQLSDNLQAARNEVARLTNEYGDKAKYLMPLLSNFKQQEVWVDGIHAFLQQQEARTTAPVKHYNKVVAALAKMKADLKDLIDDLIVQNTTPGRTLDPGKPILRFERPPAGSVDTDASEPPQESRHVRSGMVEGFWGWLFSWAQRAEAFLRNFVQGRRAVETELGL